MQDDTLTILNSVLGAIVSASNDLLNIPAYEPPSGSGYANPRVKRAWETLDGAYKDLRKLIEETEKTK